VQPIVLFIVNVVHQLRYVPISYAASVAVDSIVADAIITRGCMALDRVHNSRRPWGAAWLSRRHFLTL